MDLFFIIINFIYMQRIAGSHFDRDGPSFVKFERELPPGSSSPFILAVEFNRLVQIWEAFKK